VIDPKKRYTPLEALLDPWIMEGLPEEIKHQHLAFIKAKIKGEKKKG
jgi:dual specificity tyrosine-phosphorylation-regulated kinase 2/3/4